LVVLPQVVEILAWLIPKNGPFSVVATQMISNYINQKAIELLP
jgi:hypothetical protein